MPEQRDLQLIHGLQATIATAGARLLTTINKVVTYHGPGKLDILANTLKTNGAQLCQALKGNGKNFDVRWLPGVAVYDETHEIASEVASWHDLIVVPRRPLSDKQRLELLKAELRAGGADVDAIEERAYGRGEP